MIIEPKNLGTKDIKTFSPTTTEDCLEIIKYFTNEPALICLKSSDKAIKQRIIDVLCGAVTALDMGMCIVDRDNILIIKK